MAMRWYSTSKSSTVNLDILKVKDKFDFLNKVSINGKDSLEEYYSLYHSVFIDKSTVHSFLTFEEYIKYLEGYDYDYVIECSRSIEG
jgi:hypothetical protein